MRRSYHAVVCAWLLARSRSRSFGAGVLVFVLVLLGANRSTLAQEHEVGGADGAVHQVDSGVAAATPSPPPPPPPPPSASSTPSATTSAAPATTTTAAAAPRPSASADAAARIVDVKVRDKHVFTFRAARGGRTAAERAKTAQNTLDGLLAHPEQLGDVRYEEAQAQGTAVVYVGKTPVFTLGQEDVDASGEANLGVLAAQVASRLTEAVSSERKRSAIATTVFSVSLLIFSALIAFWLLGRVSEVAAKLRTWMADNPERLAGLRLGKIEVISAGATRGGSTIAVTLGHRLTQIAIAYAWLIFGLSLFEATRGYTEKLTGLIVTPLYALATRVGSALPVFLVAGIAVLAVSVLVRFTGLFFDSVARGDTKIVWLPRDLAQPTSALVRFGIVVIALVLASPLITGESDGALSRVGLVALVAVALASTPLLASAVVGTVIVYGRRLKKGELVEFGGRAGRVAEVRLLDVRLEDAGACDISVPHLLGLFHPTRVHRHPPLTSIDVIVDAAASQADVEKGLLVAAHAISSRGRVELVYLDANGAHWRVTSASYRGEMTLSRSVQEALAKLGVGLGQKSGAGAGAGAGAGLGTKVTSANERGSNPNPSDDAPPRSTTADAPASSTTTKTDDV